MSKRSENVKRWRKVTKARMLASMGGKCAVCGYDACIQALEFHHIDPDLKLFTLSGNCVSWAKTVVELRKCVLLCSNCHREIHHSGLVLLESHTKFNENYADHTLEANKAEIEKFIPR